MSFVDYFVVFLILGGFIYLLVQLRRKRGGSAASAFIITYGATDAFYNQQQKKAIEMIADRNAQKKMDEQGTSDDSDPSPDEIIYPPNTESVQPDDSGNPR